MKYEIGDKVVFNYGYNYGGIIGTGTIVDKRNTGVNSEIVFEIKSASSSDRFFRTEDSIKHYCPSIQEIKTLLKL